LVQQYGKIAFDLLSKTPLDASKTLDAGMITDHLGALEVGPNGIDMSQFKPFPMQVPNTDPADALMNPKMPPGDGMWYKLLLLVGTRWSPGNGPGVDGKTYMRTGAKVLAVQGAFEEQ
jgi:hypothetical protein